VNPLSIAPNNGGFTTLLYDTSTNQIVKSQSTTTTASKTFVIDHPTKPDNFLVHACLEGPEAGVYYRGRGCIKNGTFKSNVQLPEYTLAFGNFTAHVTCIGSPVLLGVSEISYGLFTVYSENTTRKDIEFNWIVYGRRNNIETEPLRMETTVHGNGPYVWI